MERSCFELPWGAAGGVEAEGRSHPIPAGFDGGGNALQGSAETLWVGRAWLPALLLQGPWMEPFPPSPPWFSGMQN